MTTDRTVSATLLRRLRTYQAERFPLVAYAPLMAVATFAAVAFSVAARAARATAGVGEIPWVAWLVGAYTVLAIFFFLRVLDEHKDAADDARYRPELPVPRGLVTLRELRAAALLVVAPALLLNGLLDPALLVPLAAVLAWAGFMGREFFVRDWLRARPALYLLSHMLVMPLIFLYATALDWLVAGGQPPPGTATFLGMAFLNGIVIEIGRKLRAPGEEREGVDTYTAAWGHRVAALTWIAAVLGAALLALVLVRPVEGSDLVTGSLVLAILGIACAAPAAILLARPLRARGAWIEAAAGVWVLGSYGVIGVVAYFWGIAG